MTRFFPKTLDHASPRTVEKQFFSLLQGLNEDHWVWFKPSIRHGNRGCRPPFVLLGPGYGLVVLYIVPWGPRDIVQGTANWMLVRVKEGKVVRREHPEHEAREAAFVLSARLEAVLSPVGNGDSGFPVGSGVVMPHLGRFDVDELGARGIPLHRDRILCQEDLDGNALLPALKRLRESPRPAKPDRAFRERVRAVIEPQLHFLDLRAAPAPAIKSSVATPAEPPAPELSETPGPVPSEIPARDTAIPASPGFWLDRKQERMARELASPRALVYGPAGSGKTVFLLSRAQYWLDRRPETRVLFTCYNASLASHIRQVFRARGIAADGERLTVRHYHDLCSFILGMDDIHTRSPEFYAALEPKVLQELSRRDEPPLYDLILVDEGQDFTRRMVEVLVRLSADGGEITLVCDPAQDIYGRWTADNLSPFREHDVEHLVDCYRNTAPIFSLARSVLPAEIRKAMGMTRLEMTRPEDLGRTGPLPELKGLDGLDDLITLLADQVEIFTREGRPLSELAILYPDRGAIPGFGARLAGSSWRAAVDPRFQEDMGEEETAPPDIVQGTLHPQSDRDDAPPSDRPHFAEALEQELRSREIPAEWMARDFATKATYDIAKPRMTLSTVHSAKGMDFHTVVLLGVESLIPREGPAGQRAQSLLFTGITRARDRLVIPYFEDRGWIPELRSRLAEIETDLGG